MRDILSDRRYQFGYDIDEINTIITRMKNALYPRESRMGIIRGRK
jgi:hypothetical protein